MEAPESNQVISRDRYDAVLFDLDGVITNTASIHAACWKQMFDEFLRKCAAERGEPFRPFDPVEDYHLHVDGKPRFDGVRDFLKARHIHLTDGNLHDPPEVKTVGGLSNRKNKLVVKAIEESGVEAYEGSVRYIRQLRRDGYKLAVVSSSENCKAILHAAKLEDLFDLRVDGTLIAAQHIAGKPAPDSFLVAAKLLGVEPSRTIVVEDALAGVEAGAAGHFGLVIGVARRVNPEELRRHGAYLVVSDLSELVEGRPSWRNSG